MKYNYNLDLSKVHPTVKEKVTSPHFHLSEKILDKRIGLGYDYEKNGRNFQHYNRCFC